ncbi:MAG: hypothetical protein GY794_08280 [bacterium]|nr:hypothetical protein [bacterium]
MTKFTIRMIGAVVLSVSISAIVLAKTPAKQETSSQSDPKAKVDPKAAAKADALVKYKKFMECYKSGSLADIKDELKKVRRVKFLLPRSAQKDIAYIPSTLSKYRPSWWKHMRSSSNVSFQITLWGKRLTANYMPSDEVGVMMPVDIKNGRVVCVVSWRPSMIDNPKAAGGYLAKRHKLAKAALGEAIGWHELGHNYITYFLPAKHVLALYENHSKLFSHLQEFYADLTSLYHSSPGGRLALMFTRLEGLQSYDESEEHDRAGFAVGSIILAKVLASPDKWPSIHFPPKVPSGKIELETLKYIYEQIDPNWSIDEDKAYRAIVKKIITSQGSKIFRSKGKIMLPNKIPFMLMVSDDREYQKKRDAWVKTKLEKIIKSGRADKVPAVKKRSFDTPIEAY